MKRFLATVALLLGSAPIAFGAEGADAGGYFTLINVLWVFVGLIFLIAVGGLFGKYIAPMIETLPPWLIEVGAYVCSAAAGFASLRYFGPVVSFITALISIPFFAAAITWRTIDIHWRVPLLAVVAYTAALAVVHQSPFFGGVSVLVLLWFCGSWIFPYISTEQSTQFVPSAFWSAAAMLAVGVALSFWNALPQFAYFKPGVFWLAGLTYAGGLMTLSCRYYYRDRAINVAWLFWQVVAIASGIGALYLGHVYASRLGTTVLQEIGGTYLALYLIEKVTEIPWDFNHWPWIALGFAGASYFAVNFASQHPEYFLAF